MRDIWPNETSDFTKWLAKKNNIKLLSNLLGFDLIVDRIEASKESRLRLDILATDKNTGEKIIIENQLGQSDYKHLGQIIIYASMFKSTKIVWVVGETRFEYENAINWLNNNSHDEISIFLVKIDVITIDDSKAAPLFTLISKPKNHQLPSILNEVDEDIAEELFKKSSRSHPYYDENIIHFFEYQIELGVTYSKYTSDVAPSILEKLLHYDPDLYKKYSKKHSSQLKNDLKKYCVDKGFQLNEDCYRRNGTRDHKVNGSEFFTITNYNHIK